MIPKKYFGWRFANVNLDLIIVHPPLLDMEVMQVLYFNAAQMRANAPDTWTLALGPAPVETRRGCTFASVALDRETM
jgi:hypothetical protein